MPASARTPWATERDAPGAGRLLVGDGVDDQVARQADVEAGEHLGREHHRGDAALHVAGAAAVELAVADDGRVRVVRPARLGLARDDVDVAVQQEAATAAGAGEARDQLRPAVEVELERHLAPAHVPRPRLPDVDRAPGCRRRSPRYACSAASSRGGSPGSRAVVSKRISAKRARRARRGSRRSPRRCAARGRPSSCIEPHVRARRTHSRSCTSTRNAAPLPCGSLSASSHSRSGS